MPVGRTAVLLAVGAVLTACSAGGDEATALPPVAPTPTVAAPSATPAGKDAPTAQGAVDFAKHFYAQVAAAFASKKPELVANLSDPGCKTCRTYVASLTRLRDRDERVTPVVFEIAFAEAPATDGRTARVDVIFNVNASTRYDAAGKVIYREAASKAINETIELVRVENSWRVSEIR